MKKISYILALVFLFSCAEKLLDKPDNLIPKNKMILILNDLAILNAAKISNVGVLQDHNIEPMPFIYEKYGIDSIQYVESDRYYASIPKEQEAIYTAVEKILEEEEKRVTQEKKVRDSLKREERRLKKNRKPTSDSLQRISAPKKL